jgi:hypothetical protein
MFWPVRGRLSAPRLKVASAALAGPECQIEASTPDIRADLALCLLHKARVRLSRADRQPCRLLPDITKTMNQWRLLANVRERSRFEEPRDVPPEETSREDLHPALFYGVFALIIAMTVIRALGHPVWDDALFFQRIGFNIVHSGVAAWNVADGPVHGSTSQLFQLVAAALVAIAPSHYQLAVRLLLGVCLFSAFWLVTAMTPRGGSRLTLVFCAFCAPTLLLLVESGMETLLALDAVALALLVVDRARERRFGSPMREFGAFVVSELLVYVTRPDLMLITATASLMLVERSGGSLRLLRYARMVLGVVAGLTVLLYVFHKYYGSVLPLSFYVKNRALTHYDSAYKSLDIPASARQFATSLIVGAPFVYIALYDVCKRTVMLLTAAAALLAYELTFTLEIMGYHSRFFIPALVPVLLAAVAAWPNFVGRDGYIRRVLPLLLGWPALVWYSVRYRFVEATGVDDPVSWISAGQYIMYIAPTLLLLCMPLLGLGWQRYALLGVPALSLAICAARPLHSPAVIDDASIERATAVAWQGLEEVKRCFREPMHMYQSELGLPGVMFLHSRITDLSGLMNPDIAFGRSDYESDCLRDPPEVLFLPHWTQKHFNERIVNGRCIQLFVGVTGISPSSTPLYIRRDLFPAFEHCLRETF